MVSDIIRPEHDDTERSHLDTIGPDTPTTDLAKSLRFVAKWTLNPPHPVPLQEAARRLDRLGDLEAIVRDLAASEPILSVGGREDDDYVCSLCPDEWYEQQPYYQRHDDVKHSPQCAWLLAEAWVSAHPVSGDQP